jgi:1-acyl-sn-glycerol-3-phosphate acyltransferase
MLDKAWRTVGTGFCFGLFGVGGLVLALLVFPAFNLFIRNPTRRAEVAQASVHKSWRLFVAIMAATRALSYETKGVEGLKSLRGTIVVANHPSLIDVVFLMAFMRRTRAVVKEGVWRNPFMAGVVSAARYIPNHRDPDRLVAECAQALKEGYNLVIFPEGSRTPPGQKRRYQKGFAHIALAAGAPVQVCTIVVDPPWLLKGTPWRRIPDRRPHWAIRVHERIDTVGQYGYDRTAAAVRQLATDVGERIEDLLRE